MKILLVEDDPELADIIGKLLKRENHVLDFAETLAVAREAILDTEYPVVLLDRMLPDGDGLELISFADRNNIHTRFLILSALDELEQRIEGLDIGADDYIPKPFEPDELLARIRVLMRRPLPEREKIINYGNLRFNVNTRSFTMDGEALLIPRREMVILEALIARAGRVVTREYIESAMYGYDAEIQSNTLESHMSRLRKKLSQYDAGVEIQTARGVGYLLKEVD